MISDVQVYPLKKDHPKIKANGSFMINNAFRVQFTLYAGPKGLFVGFPGQEGQKVNEKTGKKEWFPFVSVKNEEVSKQLQQLVISEYNKRKGNTGASATQSRPTQTQQTSSAVEDDSW
jgi:DNA-binding cell septation regulator SpoVG